MYIFAQKDHIHFWTGSKVLMTHFDSQTWVEFQKQRKNTKPEDGGKNPTNPELETFLWYVEYYFLCIIFFSPLKSSLCATYRPKPCSVLLQTKKGVEELRRARKQEVGGQRSCTAQLARKQGKEMYFSREMEPTTAQKAVTPPVSNYGCDSDKPAT